VKYAPAQGLASTPQASSVIAGLPIAHALPQREERRVALVSLLDLVAEPVGPELRQVPFSGLDAEPRAFDGRLKMICTSPSLPSRSIQSFVPSSTMPILLRAPLAPDPKLAARAVEVLKGGEAGEEGGHPSGVGHCWSSASLLGQHS
jgi:hypothetical protein